MYLGCNVYVQVTMVLLIRQSALGSTHGIQAGAPLHSRAVFHFSVSSSLAPLLQRNYRNNIQLYPPFSLAAVRPGPVRSHATPAWQTLAGSWLFQLGHVVARPVNETRPFSPGCCRSGVLRDFFSGGASALRNHYDSVTLKGPGSPSHAAV